MSEITTPESMDDAVQNEPALPETGSYLSTFQPNVKLTPYPLKAILAKYGLSGPRVPAKSLIDKTFVIRGAKPFPSTYDPNKHAYFCVCVDLETGELFTTVLGGSAVVDILDAIANTDLQQPLEVTMRLVEGGRYGRYYVLE